MIAPLVSCSFLYFTKFCLDLAEGTIPSAGKGLSFFVVEAGGFILFEKRVGLVIVPKQEFAGILGYIYILFSVNFQITCSYMIIIANLLVKRHDITQKR